MCNVIDVNWNRVKCAADVVAVMYRRRSYAVLVGRQLSTKILYCIHAADIHHYQHRAVACASVANRRYVTFHLMIRVSPIMAMGCRNPWPLIWLQNCVSFLRWGGMIKGQTYGKWAFQKILKRRVINSSQKLHTREASK